MRRARTCARRGRAPAGLLAELAPGRVLSPSWPVGRDAAIPGSPDLTGTSMFLIGPERPQRCAIDGRRRTPAAHRCSRDYWKLATSNRMAEPATMTGQLLTQPTALLAPPRR